MFKPEHFHSYKDFLNVLGRTSEELTEDSIHQELFSVEHFELFAGTLARELKVSTRPRKEKSLKADLKRRGPQLEASYQALAQAIQNKKIVSPASEIFVDNFHIIESQFREIKQDLPDDYYFGLPQLSEGELKGYPRVYAIALVIMAHSDSHIDPVVLERFLVAYQKITPLQLGELWALVITLRIVLVQHISLRAKRLVSARDNRAKADEFADRLLAYSIEADVSDRDLVSFLSRELKNFKSLHRSFLVQLIQRLRDQNSDIWPAFNWIEKKLEGLGTSAEKLTTLELHLQASGQVAVGNIISSMRLASALNWQEFIEKVNLIDPILSHDPSGDYLQMDFATRDYYRHSVERIAKRSGLTEIEVAKKAIAAGEHVGEHLIGERHRDFKKSCGYRPSIRDRIHNTIQRYPTFFYLGSLTILTSSLLATVILYFLQHADENTSVYIYLFALIAVFPASELALSFLNHYTTYFIRPAFIPRMEVKKGIPGNELTMVVIPTMFSSEPVVSELIERLEIHALANSDSKLTFALLGDFLDAPTETMPSDDALLHFAQKGIQSLNDRYCPNTEPRFHLFHRKRIWNPWEEAWIGWERKRGKLLEFNQILRGATDTTYIVVTAGHELCSQIKYVITLDSDTQLPRDSAKKLVGTILHPLNRPKVDRELRRVTSGYGILQPRISITSTSALESKFAKISSGNTGIDPYTTAVSDVYQDLFGEGSFTGKGLYVVDTFDEVMRERVPVNTVLSHDLFEGSYARCALVTDVELFDDYPRDYETYSKRGHRWTRGDWQISDWIFPLVRNYKHRWVRNDLSVISRWKIFDNLRRSLVPVATLIWLLLAWSVLPGSAAFWSLLILLVFLFPIYSTVATGEWMRRGNVTWRGHILVGWREFQIKLGQILLTLSFLAQTAWTQADAIVRVMYRMSISRRKLLEWTSFALLSSRQSQSITFDDFIKPGPLLAIGIGAIAFYTRSQSVVIFSPFLILWFANPWIKQWLRKKPTTVIQKLDDDEILEYRAFARSTWHFFETFVGAQDHWLAPDNFQENPKPVVAHRTSPTNIGLQLLASASAYDLGYIGKLRLLEQSEATFETIKTLPTFHGHLYNWYDTQTLRPLQPRYISTVDSGNLAGHLLAMKQFFCEIKNSHRSYFELSQGLVDTLLRLKDSLSLDDVDTNHTQLLDAISQSLKILRESNVQSVETWRDILDSVSHKMSDAQDLIEAISAQFPEKTLLLEVSKDWVSSALRLTRDFLRDTEIESESFAQRLIALANICEALFMKMDFSFLYDKSRKLFVIGFNVEDNRPDNSYYDLLASESRLASFVAIAKGDVGQEHWFRLGRQMAPVKGGRALVAWTATMFEYLMPLIVMKRYADTLLDQTYEAVVQRQIEYGIEKSVPWGVSESGFNARDLQMNYQYGPFGVPGLGLKRGLSDELVVSPYSSMLAALIRPLDALNNLLRLKELGAFSRYGFYESIDYTYERIPAKQKFVILQSYMAHHQGMGLVSINNILHHSIMQKRFHTDTLVQATELLLQERIPPSVELTRPRTEEIENSGFLHSATDYHSRLYSDVGLSLPRTQLLSNGSYSVLLTSTGAGYSRCGPYAVTRWREDATRDHWGQYFYVLKRNTNDYWSATAHPIDKAPESFGANLSEDRVEFWRKDKKCLTRMEVIVSPEDNVELRKITLTNESDSTQEFEVTSFMETVFAKPNDDNAHLAFSNLFVQTEFLAKNSALLGTRRPRSVSENPPWGFHLLTTDGVKVGALQFETDRARFIGRGRTSSNPWVIQEKRPLSNTVGSVLDPIFALRQTFKVLPGEMVSMTFITGLAESRTKAIELIEKYNDVHTYQRESDISWTQAQVQLRHLNINNAKAHIYQRLAGRVLYLDPSLRPSSDVLAQNTRAQTNLWAYGISGDIPIILSQISDEKDMLMIRELLHAHEYLRLKGLVIDLVILNERNPSYLQSLQDELQGQIRMSGSQALLDKPGGIFLRRTDLMPKEDVILLRTVARVILQADKGTLEEQLKHRKYRSTMSAPLAPKFQASYPSIPDVQLPQLDFFNGIGGFSKKDNEYIINLKDGQWTPAPWINVIANPLDFGFTISESGSGYTWSVNSRENRLTPWSNDPISDPPGEIIYLRDEESGEYWTPTPLPIRQTAPYAIRHGQGYSSFNHSSRGIEQNLEMFVALGDRVKISRLKLKNHSSVLRRLSVTSYTEWVMGFQRGSSAQYIIPIRDEVSQSIIARNPYNNEFASRVAFSAISEVEHSYTCDRREFLGRNGNPAKPAALGRVDLSNTSGAGLDPCAAFQTKIDLNPGEERTIIILLGDAENNFEARELVEKYRSLEKVEETYQEIRQYWDKTLSVLEINTPDLAMDTLVNRWLVYQTLSCRIWARSAFYQSGGAFGFRDQLQDVMALVYSHPEITRNQILTAAARQFCEGDVQHWWHPPTGRGVRTHFSDDLLWLPFVVAFYVKHTGDTSILKEEVAFIEAPLLNPGQDDSYTHPTISHESASVLEHCARALDRSLKVGVHGLPLMGSGDWNDGMNRVGHEGKGESVWVAWFLSSTLQQFIPLCDGLEEKRVAAYKQHLKDLKVAVEDNAWDGDWYRRAYFDDGTPLGSTENTECRIDSISQSWAVLSKMGDPERSRRAMGAVNEFLIRREEGLVQLFTPAFDKTPLDPGYVKGYVPGVRENGGQYTHAAIWTLMAYAELGDGDQASELYNLLNPINHSSTRAGMHKYRVEPYVVAADVYGQYPHIGRGGWTWYTGSASWMYRAAIESILGFEIKGEAFRVKPKVPSSWNHFSITYRYGTSTFFIKLVRGERTAKGDDWIPLVSDGNEHQVTIHF